MDFIGGEFHNYYKIELVKDYPDLKLKKGDLVEVKGKDNDFFEYKKQKIKKIDTKILKKMIRPVR